MKKAFTMLELVFVIVVVGILSYFAASSFQRNPLREAADQVVSHIRYTQHLAMQDDKFDANDATWYRERWQIVFNSDAFTNQTWAYTVFSSRNQNANVDVNEPAKNPSNPSKELTGGYTGYINTNNTLATRELNLGQYYGVTNIVFSASCQFAGSQRISFDYLGRPLKGVPNGFAAIYQANRLITNDCSIALIGSDGNVTITIKPETGYTYISSQNY